MNSSMETWTDESVDLYGNDNSEEARKGLKHIIGQQSVDLIIDDHPVKHTQFMEEQQIKTPCKMIIGTIFLRVS